MLHYYISFSSHTVEKKLKIPLNENEVRGLMEDYIELAHK